MMMTLDYEIQPLFRWIERAKGIALTSDVKHKLGAVCLSKSGRLLSLASNTKRTHPVQARFAKANGLPQKKSLHAEMCALLRSKSQVHTLIVVRVNRRGELRLAKPCCICTEAIGEHDVSHVLYSTFNGMEEMLFN